MKRPSAKDELRTGLTESLHAALTEITGQRSAIPDQLIEQAVNRVIEDWRVTRVDTPNADEYPLRPEPHGHYLKVTLPHVPETDDERTERELRWEAYLWDADDGPPPERVGVRQLLRQDTWWRMTAPDRPGATGNRGVRLPTIPVRIEDMTHDHRVSLLAWLRQRAERLHSDAFGELWGAPDDVWAFHERQDPREWLEENELVQALVHWTTPYGEAPLTWRPMNEAPRDGTDVMVRWPDGGDLDEPDRAFWSQAGYCWYLRGGTGTFQDAAFAAWRELRDDEKPVPVKYCDHENYQGRPCEDCGAGFYPCDHGGVHGSDYCAACEQE
jgi:hypothetical protein